MSNRPIWKELGQDPFLKESLRSAWVRYLLFFFLSFFLMGWIVSCYEAPEDQTIQSPERVGTTPVTDSDTFVPETVRQRVNQVSAPYKVGLIVGHRGSDSGATCSDTGIYEITITEDISSKVTNLLQEDQITVELFDEYDPGLNSYLGDAIVSLHADSCGFDLSGYKTAVSVSPSSSFLQECINREYESITGLAFHQNTVTPDMTSYHAFDVINPAVPALILELGFMDGDYELLTTNSDVVASAIRSGILCYLNK